MTSAFTSNGELFAAILPDNTLKVWNTSGGKLLAEWKQDGDSDVQFSCIACSFVGKKRKKETSNCLVALGTEAGEVFAINAKDGEMKWKSSGHHHGRIVALSFSNKGRKVCAISTNGTTCELNSESGELQKEFKISKKYISSSVYFSDDKILAAASSKIRVLSLEDGEELLKFSTDGGPVQHISILDEKNIIITSGAGDKNLQVWKTESSSETVTTGPILSMRHPPLAIECKNGDGDTLFVLSVSESGIGYVWNVETSSEENIVPTKIKVEAAKSASDLIASEKTKKRHVSILAANLNPIGGDEVEVCIVYGSLNSPQFTSVDFASPGEDVNIRVNIQEIGVNDGKDQKDARGKKRAASDPESKNNHGDPVDAVQIDDSDEPTMGEKLASLNIVNNEDGSLEKPEMSPAKPPSADSVHVLLKQALHADDRSLLLDCLFRQNEKVITNSIALLKPSDVFKLLETLIPMIQSRGAVAACALPWLKSLLLQHASIIMSQEASLIALNSLYQIIESRVSTFNPAVQLSSSLDLLYAKVSKTYYKYSSTCQSSVLHAIHAISFIFLSDGVDEEEGPPEPIIFEDYSDEEGSEAGGDDVMETDEDDNEEHEEVSNVSDLEGSDGMVDF